MWVERMLDDRARNESGLRRWVGHDQRRADLYNAAYRAVRESETPSSLLFGYAQERAGWKPLPSRSPGRNLGVAVGFAILLGGSALGLGLGVLSGRLDVAGVHAPAAPETIATRVGEIRRVTLPDGTQVILDTDSMLHVAFDGTARSVHLDRGRARFEVAHKSDWPFVVSAAGGTITAHGTVFDVAVYHSVNVHLLSGVVDVQFPGGLRQAAPARLRLKAGEQVHYDPSTSEGPPAPSQASASDAQWVAGTRTFDDVQIDDIIEEANRYSVTKIQLSDPSLGTHRAFLDLDPRNTRDVAHNLAIFLGLREDKCRPDVIVLEPAEK